MAAFSFSQVYESRDTLAIREVFPEPESPWTTSGMVLLSDTNFLMAWNGQQRDNLHIVQLERL